MKVLAVWNYKGGVGKSTISENLAHALTNMGKRVVIFDNDPQGSSRLAFDENPEFPFLVTDREEMIEPEHVDIVLVDFRPGVPGQKVLKESGADLVVIPMLATVPDFHAACRGIKTFNNNVPLIPVLNRYDAGSLYEREVKELIQEAYPDLVVIPKRSAFANANNEFKTVFCFDMKKQRNMREAGNFINELAEVVLAKLNK